MNKKNTYSVGQRVVNKKDIRTLDGKSVPKGTEGTVIISNWEDEDYEVEWDNGVKLCCLPSEIKPLVAKVALMNKKDLVLEAVLLFHSEGWSEVSKHKWREIAREVLGLPNTAYHPLYGPTGWECTSKVLCDMVRAVQKE